MNAELRTTAAVGVLAAWLGAALLLSTSVAPAAFDVLQNRTLAGSVVGRVLPVVFIGGLVAGIAALALSWRGGALLRTRRALGAVIVLACAAAQLVVAPRIARVRSGIEGAVDALAVDDPRRVAFGRLHAISVGWLGLAMVAAAALLVLLFVASRRQTGRT
jgi:hypothetical protein